jgi:hypothetical protein
MKPVNAVQTNSRVVGVLIDAPGAQVPTLASAASEQGYQVTFSLEQAPSESELDALHADEEQAVPRLPSSGLVGWLGTRGYLRRMIHAFGYGHHFLYTSRGRPIAGAVELNADDAIGKLHAGEVVELSVHNEASLLPLLIALHRRLHDEGLHAVPVAELMRDAGAQA